MLIYIMHSDRFYTFQLPEIVSGNYMIEDSDSSGSVKNLVNVVDHNSKWVMSSNENVRIVVNNQYVESCELDYYCWYFLSTFYGERILLYTMPSYEPNYLVKSFDGNGKITVGNSSKCDITFSHGFLLDEQLEIEFNNDKWYVKNLNSKVYMYVNNVSCNSCCLDSFDRVFVGGFKFLVCGRLIFIDNPSNCVNIHSNKLIEPLMVLSASNYKSIFQNYTDYYNSADYFSKSPVFFKRNNCVDINLQPPEEKERPEYQSLLMTMIPSALMGVTSLITTYYTIRNYATGQGDEESLITTIVMLIIMFILCFIWPVIERLSDRLRNFLRNRSRISIYKRYLNEKRKLLEKITNEQKIALFFNNPSLEECQNIIMNRTANLFSLNPEQEQFLKVRLGTGKVLLNCNFNYNKPDFVKYVDPLQKELEKMIEKYRYIDQAPLSISLKNSIAFLNANADYDKCLESLIIQIATLHDYHDVKIVAFTSDNSKLSSIRLLNHCWNDDRSFRYVATNLQEAESLSTELMKIYNKRCSVEDNDLVQLPYFIIITDEIDKFRNVKIIDEVIHKQKDYGFSFVTFAKKITEVPDGCSYFCDYSHTPATLFQIDMEEKDVISFEQEFVVGQVDFSKCISMLANIPIKSNSEGSIGVTLPEKLGFLEMYNVGNVQQLNSADRWRNSQIVNTLSAPIGVDMTGSILNLDLHEKKHGPHGLIAGMTGSGKSETIITYLLSLAVNYSPDEVQFVLIDYKGGGLAGAFENRRTGIKLPHLVGTITNLDTSEMNRTLVSIKSELQRRQKIFNRAKEELNTGTIDIYKYQGLVRDGQIKEPLSHLFIVCDEFAELKQQQPDFMDEIVSVARIGRSLGIHLILATQKPSGVVDDQVWSNSRFKICHKVQTAEDSSEMLRKPDAAYIKESGRFYLQIGYDESYVLAQAAYTGNEYVPSDRAVSNLDTNISFVNTLGETYKNANYKIARPITEEKSSNGVELINIVRYLIDVAKKGNYKYHQLWLDNIPNVLSYDTLIKKYQPSITIYDINPVIGEYDDPARQNQGLVTLPITTGGNTFIGGNSGSGKSTLLSTIISSTIINHNSEEVNIYIIDMGAEKLKKFSDAPQVGDVLTVSDSAEIKFLIFMLQYELVIRQKYYAEHGGDFIHDVKNKKCIFPNILVFLYDIDTFKENFEFFFEENIIPLTRNCSKYGINFIVTGNTSNSLGYAAEQTFSQKILLNVTDPADYSMFFEKFPIIKKTPGRGVVQVGEDAFEFQSALFFQEGHELELLKNIIARLNNNLKSRAKRVPRIPDKVSYEFIKDYISDLEHVPVGVNTLNAQIAYFNFNDTVSVISSERPNSFSKFSMALQKILLSIPNTKIIVLNALENYKINFNEGIKVYESGFAKILPVLKNNILKYNNMSSDENFIVIILNFSGLNERLKEYLQENQAEDIPTIIDIINCSKANHNFKFILYDVSSSSDELKNGDIMDYFDGSRGLWIGNGFDGQTIFESSNGYDFGIVNDETIIKIDNGVAFEIKSIR